MLLRAAAIGVKSGPWHAILQRLQSDLPNIRFESALLDSPNTLTQIFSPHALEYWALQPADFIFCGLDPLITSDQRLFKAILRMDALKPAGQFILLFPGLEKGLGKLMRSPHAMRFNLATGERLQCHDAGLLLTGKNMSIPNLPQHPSPTQLLWKPALAKQAQQEVVQAKEGLLVGFAELQAIQDEHGRVWPPKEWLRRILKTQPNTTEWRWRTLGFMYNKGWHLHGGIPLERIRSLDLAPSQNAFQHALPLPKKDASQRKPHKIGFKHLVDLRHLDKQAPAWQKLLEQLQQSGKAFNARQQQLQQTLRLAAVRTDLPLLLGDGAPLLNHAVARYLRNQGFHRCQIWQKNRLQNTNETTLLLALGPRKEKPLTPSLAPTQVLNLHHIFHRALEPLNQLLDWAKIPAPVPHDHPPRLHEPPQPLRKRQKALEEALAHWEAAREDWLMRTMEMKMCRQEARLLQQGIQQAAALLKGPHAAQLWQAQTHPGRHNAQVEPNPTTPPTTTQGNSFLQRTKHPVTTVIWEDDNPAPEPRGKGEGPGETLAEEQTASPQAMPEEALVFSMEKEEAARMLHSLQRYPKRLWVDIHLAAEPQGLIKINADALSQWQTAWVSPHAKEQIAHSAQQAQQALSTAWELLQKHHQQALNARSQAKQFRLQVQNLGRTWVEQEVEHMLQAQENHLFQAFDQALNQHERSWLSRALIHRVLLFCSQPSHLLFWQKALQQVYPGLVAEQCQLQAINLHASATRLRENKTIPFSKTLLKSASQQAAKSASQASPPDLIIIEHHSRMAFAVLQALQQHTKLRRRPCFIFTADAWLPSNPKDPMPWPYTRVQWLPRLAPLRAEQCVENLLRLHPR